MTLCPGPGLQNHLARLWLRREPPAASAETWRSLHEEGLYATRGWLGDSTSRMAGAPEGAEREAGRVRAGKKEERAGVLLRGSGLRYKKGERFDRQAQTISGQRSRSYKDSAITGLCHDPIAVTIYRGRWLVVTLPVLRAFTSY